MWTKTRVIDTSTKVSTITQDGALNMTYKAVKIGKGRGIQKIIDKKIEETLCKMENEGWTFIQLIASKNDGKGENSEYIALFHQVFKW